MNQLPPVNDPFGSANLSAVPMPSTPEPVPVPTHTSLAPAPVEVAAADHFNADDYVFVNVGGVVRAIPKSAVHDTPETATQTLPPTVMVPKVDPHFYVWLANGDVIRVKESDLPTPAGTNAPLGHWQNGNKVYLIVNVFPVEDVVKE